MWWSQVLAASADPVALSQYGLAGIVILALTAAVRLLWNEVARLNADRIAREQALSDKLGPLLAEAIRVLPTVQERFEKALAQVEDSSRASDLERTVARLMREQSKRAEP